MTQLENRFSIVAGFYYGTVNPTHEQLIITQVTLLFAYS